MIEIEKKFLLSEAEQTSLLTDATKLETKQVTDSYFDTNDHSLTLRDFWLRKRNGSYELKAPLKRSNTNAMTSQYHEITDEHDILSQLALKPHKTFSEALSAAGIKPFIVCYTNRTSYQKDMYHIDIDHVTYEGSSFTYSIAEIEFLIEREEDVESAEQKILEYAHTYHLETNKQIIGKVGAYLRIEDPTHYADLIHAGIF